MSGFRYTLAEIAQMMGEDAQLTGGGASDVVLAEVEFDTRQIHDGHVTLFVALQGANRDGHQFLQQAFDKGVRHFLVSDAGRLPPGSSGIVVGDTLAALQAFARAHRDRFDYPVIAITGSNGKTTVKEWLVTLLGDDFAVVKSPLSYNSQLGVALSLLQLDAQHNLAIIEAGISQKGEMERLAWMIQPTMGILTHFGDAHAEGFASPAEKLQEKLVLFKGTKVLLADAVDDGVKGALVEFVRVHPQGLWTLGVRGGEWQGARNKGNEGRKDRDFELEEVQAEASSMRGVLVCRRGDVVEHGGLRSKGLGAGSDQFLGATYSSLLGRAVDSPVAGGHGLDVALEIPLPGEAALVNAALAVMGCLMLGLAYSDIQPRLQLLRPVSMRMEMITDNPEVTIINDAYNADLSSVKNALSLLATERYHAARTLVLTDIDHQGTAQERVQKEILDLAVQALGADNILVIGPVFDRMLADVPWIASYPSTEAFIQAFDYERFRNRTVLLKGARRFGLDRLIPYLSRRATATWFKINMNALAHNYRQFRARLPRSTRIMAMVKAFAYGSGSWEIAQAVVREGVDQLAVAYTSEGIMLRTRGIQVPIMVMNADLQSIEQLYRFDLVPEVYGLDFLRQYIEAGRALGRVRFPVHIKVDTGMGRLGWDWQQAGELIAFLHSAPGVDVESVLSHLASADVGGLEEFTHTQAKRFLAFHDQLVGAIAFDAPPLKHICNTAGMLRFPEYSMDMVRLGIGLYGVPPFEGAGMDLQEIGSLHTVITQVHAYPAGTPIGYGCSERTSGPAYIATLPIGYADGIRRSLSNGKGRFLVRGQRAPVIGRVCMDMLMLDVTHILGVEAGDEVVLMGGQGDDFISVEEIAGLCGTISYEVLTGISQRVRRVYVRE
jgi:Alr-MurF fusion protein